MRTETSNKVFILMEKYGMSNIPFFNYYVLFYRKPPKLLNMPYTRGRCGWRVSYKNYLHK